MLKVICRFSQTKRLNNSILKNTMTLVTLKKVYALKTDGNDTIFSSILKKYFRIRLNLYQISYRLG
jgi:hypothetical protein